MQMPTGTQGQSERIFNFIDGDLEYILYRYS